MHSKIKNILIKCHFLREQVAGKIVKLEYISTKDQIANIFTKSLPKYTFEYLRQRLGVRFISYQIKCLRRSTRSGGVEKACKIQEGHRKGKHPSTIDVKGGEKTKRRRERRKRKYYRQGEYTDKGILKITKYRIAINGKEEIAEMFPLMFRYKTHNIPIAPVAAIRELLDTHRSLSIEMELSKEWYREECVKEIANVLEHIRTIHPMSKGRHQQKRKTSNHWKNCQINDYGGAQQDNMHEG